MDSSTRAQPLEEVLVAALVKKAPLQVAGCVTHDHSEQGDCAPDVTHCNPVRIQQKRKEKPTPLGDHNGSL